MGRFILRRIGLTLVTLVIVSMTVFAAAEVLPGDVARTILGPYATKAQVDALDHQLGVDQPLPVRYWNWATDFVQGDWGTSPVQNTEVRPYVLGRFKNSLILAAFALVLIVPALDRARRGRGAQLRTARSTASSRSRGSR